MKVQDVMVTDVVSFNENQTFRDAAIVFTQKQVTGGPVLNDQGEVIGMLSQADLAQALYPHPAEFQETPGAYENHEKREGIVKEVQTKKIKDLMNTDVVTVSPDTPVLKAGAMMLARKIQRMPVLEGDKLIGIIGRRRLFRHVFSECLSL